MNELQKRFSKKVLSPQQKRLIIEEATRSKRSFTLMPIVVPSFLIVFAVLVLSTLNGQSIIETTASTNREILSTNLFLNMCNIVLIIGTCMHIVKLMKDGQWRLRKKWRPYVQSIMFLWIVVLTTAYGIVGFSIGDSSYYKEIMFVMLLLFLVTLYILFPSDSVSGYGIIVNKIVFIFATIGIVTSFILNWTIDPLDRINATSTALNFPTKVNWEPYKIGKIGVFLFTMCVVLLIGTLKRYRALTIVVILFMLHAAPGMINYVQQTFIVQNAAAIHSYHDGVCEYDNNMQGAVEFRCEVTLKNRSNEQATFSIELYEPHPHEEYVTIAAFNELGPFTYTFKPKEKRKIVIEDVLQMGHLPENEQLYGGTTSMYVKIFDNESMHYK